MKRITAGSVYVGVMVVLAALAAWPIYRSASFLLLVVVSALLGAAIATYVQWRRAGGWAAAALVVATFFVVGVPLAVPSRLTDPASFVHGLGDLAVGAVVGWKDLLTVELPVGSYRNLLVPALVVFLVGTAVALLLAWREDSWAIAAVPVAFAMTGFGLLFGRTEVSAPLQLGLFTLAAPIETLIGIVALASGVLWLAWRSRAARLVALRQAVASSGVRMRRVAHADSRRLALGLTMAAIAAVVALGVPAAAASLDRTVLRTATGPRVEISQAVSPLSSYRALFSDAEYDQVLFRASGAHVPERIRLAVLDAYDGAVYRTGVGDGAPSFVRVASARTSGQGEPVDMQILVGGLQGIWMPSAGSLSSADFEGSRAAALADGFYVDAGLSAAVQTAGWQAGDSYRLVANVPATEDLGTIDAPGASDSDVPEPPASLTTWMKEHVSGTGGAALQGLVALLRERGYLSHALTDTQSEWMAEAGVDTFVPSASGHSLARIDQLFTALLDREHDPRAQASGNFVAAIGDDEQFAVAVSLLAHELGFPARIVVGTRTVSSDPALTVCDDGTCRADDVSAWVEVRSASGEWVSVDVTPQHTQAPSREVTAQPDPTIGTEVRPATVDEVQPPKPAQEDAPTSPDHPDAVDLSWLWNGLRLSGAVLLGALVVLGPFLVVIGAKALRRRSRRTAPAPADRIAGGWEEYLDAAADAGRRPALVGTRTEIAASLDAEAAGLLARSADEAVFSGDPATDADAVEFWRVVDAERDGFSPTRWQKLRAAVSLRSFVPGDLRRSPFRPERGRRARRDRSSARHTA